MSASPMSPEQVNSALAELPNWELSGDFIQRDFQFANFEDAFSCMTKLAFLSERLAHHPDWSNVYNRLSIRLSTHDAGGLTSKDFEWAKACDEVCKRFSS